MPGLLSPLPTGPVITIVTVKTFHCAYYPCMLVLTRAVGGSIRIGTGLLTVISVGTDVRLGFIDRGRTTKFAFKRRAFPEMESFYMGFGKVVLLDASRTEVKLGIEAPHSVRIMRAELLANERGPLRNIPAGTPPTAESSNR